MFDDLRDALSFLGSFRWPEAMGEVTAVDVEKIRITDGNIRLRLAIAYKFSLNGDGPYTGESFWKPVFSFTAEFCLRDIKFGLDSR